MIRFLESLLVIGLVCGVVGALTALFGNLLDLALHEDDQFVAPLETERKFRIVQGGRQ